MQILAVDDDESILAFLRVRLEQDGFEVSTYRTGPEALEAAASHLPDLALVDLRLPQNASIYASSDLAARLDAILGKDPDVERWSAYVGRGAIRFYLPLDVQLQNDFFTQTTALVLDKGQVVRGDVVMSAPGTSPFPDGALALRAPFRGLE